MSKTLAPEHPEWKTQQPFKAMLEDDIQTLVATGKEGLLQIMAAICDGMTAMDFEHTRKPDCYCQTSAFSPTLHGPGLSGNAGTTCLSP